MKYLHYMRISPIDEWLTIALRSRKENVGDLTLHADRIRTSYKSYEKIIYDVGTKISDSMFLNEKSLLIDYYSGAPSELSRLLVMRRSDPSLHECPYCGYPFIPDTLDHFIPKDEWPEYAFLADNLVPQCRGCAPTKGKHYFCETRNSVKFIHPFYSDLISKLAFQVEMTFTKPVPKFSVKFKSIGYLSTVEKQRLELHVEQLKIRKRLVNYCRQNFNHWLDLVRKTGANVSIAFSQRLIEQGGPDSPSENWSHAFYLAVLKNKEAMEYLNSERRIKIENSAPTIQNLDF